MTSRGNRARQFLHMESSMGAVECRSTLHTVVQTRSKYAWMLTPWRCLDAAGRAYSTSYLGPVDFGHIHPVPEGPALDILRFAGSLPLGWGTDTDSDRPRVSRYVTLTPF